MEKNAQDAWPWRAVIFDLDGTLVDSEPLHARSANAVLASYGCALDEADFADFIGWAERPFWTELRRRFALPRSVEQLVEERTRHYLKMLHPGSLKPLPGIPELLAWLAEREMPRAVASSSPRLQIDASLDAAGLAALLPVRLSGHDDVPRSKPAPDVYLAAARALAVAPADCLAMEDSPHGVLAARRAGMYVLAVRYAGNPHAELNEAHQQAASVTEFMSRFPAFVPGLADSSVQARKGGSRPG